MAIQEYYGVIFMRDITPQYAMDIAWDILILQRE